MAGSDLHLFDLCVITVSDEKSVETFTSLIKRRQEAGLYPREIEFRVYADPPAGRIGSGGGTMWALLRLLQDEGVGPKVGEPDVRSRSRGHAKGHSAAGSGIGSGAAHIDGAVDEVLSYFSHHRIVILHAGGESRRLPCYAPEGKLFAPVPVATSSVLSPVVLDTQLSLFLKYPWRDGEVLVGSGDVVIDFDTRAMKRPTAPITGFGAPAPLSQGAHHGVFRFDGAGDRVEEYYQKQPEAFLAENARIEGTDQCALDIGLISMAPEFAAALVAIGQQLRGKLAQAQVYIDIYLEILTACLGNLSEEEYLRRIGLQSRADASIRKAIYAGLHPYGLGGVLTHEPKFIHFGSLAEYPAACRELSRGSILPFYATERGELAATSLDPALVFNTTCDDAVGELQLGAHAYIEGCGPIAGVTNRASPGSTTAGPADAGSTAPGAALGGGGTADAKGSAPPAGAFGLVGVSNPADLPPIPGGIWVDERQTDRGTIMLTYGTYDSFKKTEDLSALLFCGVPIDSWLKARGLAQTDIWSRTDVGDLWAAKLFSPELSSQQLSWYWSGGDEEAQADQTPPGHRSSSEAGLDAATFRSAKRYSLREVTDMTDTQKRDDRRSAGREALLRDHLIRGRGWRTVSSADFCRLYADRRIPLPLLSAYTETVDPLLAAYRRRVIGQCGSLPKRLGEVGVGRRIRYVTPTRDTFPLRRAVKEDQIVWARCPARLDLAGGWTDTPPYTNRYGGKVVNVAVDLNGEPPIQVYCRPTTERRVRFHSIDLGVTETLTTTAEVLDFQNPASPFALPKAALVLLGVVEDRSDGTDATSVPGGSQGPASGSHPPGSDNNLERRLQEIGCGVEVTLMCAIPKGSGLGTSSVLGGTILAALARFFGVVMTKDELYLNVLAMEQMLTTGGGWQDQVGGIAGSVKYIESVSGMKPQPEVHQLDPYLFSHRDYTGRMTLFYTGVTRLAKNILQEVVDRVNDYEPAYLFTHRHLAELAEDARRVIALRDYAGLCRVVASSWGGNKLIHGSTSNDEIEAMLSSTRDSYTSVKLLGAGGGGYALFLSDSADEADRLRETLSTSFDNGRARLVDFSLNEEGLRVSVS